MFDHSLIAGDFNADFYHASINLNFLFDVNLVSADLSFHSFICFTYMRDDGSASSWPDHFICDTSLAPDLSLFCQVDFGSNLSDHSPLACFLQVDLSVTPPSFAPTQSAKTCIAWHVADSGLITSYCDLVLIISHHFRVLFVTFVILSVPYTFLHSTGFVNNSHCAFIGVQSQSCP